MKDLYYSIFKGYDPSPGKIVYEKGSFKVEKKLSFDKPPRAYYSVLMIVTSTRHYIRVGGLYRDLETVKRILDKDRPLVYL